MELNKEIENLKNNCSKLRNILTMFEAELVELEEDANRRADAKKDYEQTKPFTDYASDIRVEAVRLTQGVMRLQRAGWLRHVEHGEWIRENNSNILKMERGGDLE